MDLAGKPVLVTGADGFIGSHLVELLVERGARVRALALYNSFNSWGWLEDVPRLGDVEVVTGDVRDPALCRELVRGIEVVFNLAALIAIPYSYRAPQSYVDTNVLGALNVCQAAVESGAKRVVQMSTSEVYGTARTVPIDETHPLQPQSPYSASKIGADAIAMSMHHAFGLPVVVARPFNTYGPRQSARAVIPTIISQLLSGAREIALGDVRPTRDFTFVGDTCRALVAVAEADAAVGEVVNIGSNFEVSIGQLFAVLREIVGADATLVEDAQRLRPAGSEVQRLWCDNAKLARLTGYVPATGLRQGLEATVRWMSDPNNRRKYKPGVYNV